MYGVTIGGIHSRDLSLNLLSSSIEPPEVKTKTVSVPGTDGEVDLTEVLNGKAVYGNRVISLQFASIKERREQLPDYSEIMKLFHGNKLKIIFDEDPGYYYMGRITVNPLGSCRDYTTVQFDIDAEPYKYPLQDQNEDWEWDPFCFRDGIAQTTVWTFSGEMTVTLYNSRKTVCPSFQVISGSPVQVLYQGVLCGVVSVGETVKFYEIVMDSSEVQVTLKALGETAQISVHYRRGVL